MTTYEITFDEKTKAGKGLLTYLEQNKDHLIINDPTEMTKEEFEAKCAIAVAQYERGECTRYNREEFRKFCGLE